MKIKLFLSALRLRTLPLSLAGVVLGTSLAAADYHINPLTSVFVFLTACSLQILSNLSNELGDFLSGTESGQGRASTASLNNGEISLKGIKGMIAVWIGVSVVCGLLMIYFSFGTLFSLDSFVLMLLGYFAIKAAMKYTLGSSPYGYRGWGDLYVFLFFGLVSVGGSFFVLTHSFGSWLMLLPSAAIGFFSTAVLNVNNIRDMETDRLNRVTTAICLGDKGAKIYQCVLIIAGWVSMIVYASLRFFDLWHFLFFLVMPLFVFHLVYVWKHSGKELDASLSVLVISTFFFAVLSGAGFLAYLFI